MPRWQPGLLCFAATSSWLANLYIQIDRYISIYLCVCIPKMVSFYLATKTLPSFKQHTTVTAEILLTPLLWTRHELLNLWADLEGNSSCLWDHGGVSPLDPLLRPWNWLLLCGQSHRCCRVVGKLRQVLVHQATVSNRCVYLQVDDRVHCTLPKSWKKILTCGPIGSKMPERTNETVIVCHKLQWRLLLTIVSF